MPHIAFLLLAAGMGAVAHWLVQRKRAAEVGAPVPMAAPVEGLEVSWDDLVPVDVLGLEVGYRLIPLVDKGQDGELLRRIKAIRKKFAQEVGFLPPAVHIRDNLELAPNAYRITLKGVAIGEGECHVGMYLAINPGRATGALSGVATTDPAFGLPAQWIDATQHDHAQEYAQERLDEVTEAGCDRLPVRHAVDVGEPVSG